MLLGPLFLRRLYENKIVAKYYYLTFYSNQTLSSSVIAFGTKNGGNSPLMELVPGYSMHTLLKISFY